MSLLTSVRRFILDQRLLCAGETVLIGVSGGKDSVVLLDILHQLAPHLGIAIAVCHINHHSRGKHSDRDAIFVHQLARQYNVPCHIDHINPHQHRPTKSKEAYYRTERFRLFQKVMTKIHANKLALAHTASDQSETMLMRLVMGSGPIGLAAMRPIRDDSIIRPLLGTPSDIIRQYATERRLQWREDATNRDTRYYRNLIRHNVIPVIKTRMNPNLDNTLQNVAKLFQWNQSFLNNEMEKACQTVIDEKNQALSRSKLAALDPIIQYLVIKRYITRYLKTAPSMNLLNQVLQCVQTACGPWEISLSNRFILRHRYDKMNIIDKLKHGDIKDPTNERDRSLMLRVIPPQTVTFRNKVVQFEIKDRAEWDDFCPKGYYMDYDKLVIPLVVRLTRADDLFQPLGMTHRKRITRCFQDRKVSPEKRWETIIVQSGRDIVFVEGYTISDPYKVAHNTQRILSLAFK